MAILDGLIRHYALNDNAANTVVVDSTGTENGVSEDNTSTMTTAGHLGNALDFTESNDEFITVPDAADLDVTNFTLIWWANPDVLVSTNRMLARWGTQPRSFLSVTNGSSDYVFHIERNGGTLASVNNSTGWETGVWHMHTVTWNGTTLSYKIDNANEQTTVAAGTLDASAMPFMIGAGDAAGSHDYDGKLQLVSYYNRVLSSGEQDTHWNGGTGIAYPFANHVTISPSAFTLSTSEQSPSLFIDITQGLSLSATLGLPLFDMPKPFNRGTVGTQDIATRFPITEGLIAGTTRQTGNPNLEAREKGSF